MCTCEWYVCVCIFMCVVYIVYMSGMRVCMCIYVCIVLCMCVVCVQVSVCLYTCVGMRARSQQQFECHPSGAVNFFLFFLRQSLSLTWNSTRKLVDWSVPQVPACLCLLSTRIKSAHYTQLSTWMLGTELRQALYFLAFLSPHLVRSCWADLKMFSDLDT